MLTQDGFSMLLEKAGARPALWDIHVKTRITKSVANLAPTESTYLERKRWTA